MRAVAVRHVLFEDLGILEALLDRKGYEVEYLDAGIDDLSGSAEADLAVILGGPIGVADVESYPFLAEEIGMIGARLKAGAPTLGICLGAQLMAAALGADVRPTGRSEIGFGELQLTPVGQQSALAELEGVPVFHWHGDEFAIPEDAIRLASTEGFPNQAFSIGRHALALQFHVETDFRYLERWLIGHSGELAGAGLDPGILRDQARRCGERLEAVADRTIARWLADLQ